MRKAVVVVLLVIAAGSLILRGPVRAVSGERLSRDFSVVYGATRSWLTGNDPYDYPTLIAVLRERGYDNIFAGIRERC